MPGMPSTPTAVEIGASFGSSLRRPEPSESVCVCQPTRLSTMSPVCVFLVVRGGDLADGAGFHHLADADGLGVGRRIAHAPAHVGVEREPFRLQQHLTRPGLRHGKFLQPEVGRLRLAHRARGKHDTAGGFGHDANSGVDSLR